MPGMGYGAAGGHDLCFRAARDRPTGVAAGRTVHKIVDIDSRSCIVSALQCIPRGHKRKFSLLLFWKLLPQSAFRNELQFTATRTERFVSNGNWYREVV